MRTALAVLVASCALPVFASEPGQPIDCSDVVLNDPRLTCEEVIDCFAVDPGNSFELCNWDFDGDWARPRLVLDNEGHFYRVAWDPLLPCGGLGMSRHSLVRLDGSRWTPVAQVESRCVDPSPSHPRVDIASWSWRLMFDDKQGRFLLGMAAGRTGMITAAHVIAISGFPALADVLQASLPAGPPGPPGPPGPRGDVGPQGPPGPLPPACKDNDGDAWADCVSVPACNPYGHPCGDCNDGDAGINPGASEAIPNANRRDRKDNDCNGVVDDFPAHRHADFQ